MDQLDKKALVHFEGRVVQKSLANSLKGQINVPAYVLEYLLGKYCSSRDREVVGAGLEEVRRVLQEHYVRPDQAEWFKAQVRERGRHQVIDIENLRPIQLARTDILDEVKEARPHFSREEWIDFLLRSVGVEPTSLSPRLKLLYLCRLIPLVEANFNLVELAPRGTGKSFVYRETSPYAILVSGGEVTVPSLFVAHIGRGRLGLVALWDVVAFDEVAGLTRLANPQAINLLKDYMATVRIRLLAEPRTVFDVPRRVAVEVSGPGIHKTSEAVEIGIQTPEVSLSLTWSSGLLAAETPPEKLTFKLIDVDTQEILGEPREIPVVMLFT